MNEARYREAERRLWESVGVTPTEQQLRLERTGVTVRVQEAGDGPAVVFVHGLSNSGVSWAPLGRAARWLPLLGGGSARLRPQRTTPVHARRPGEAGRVRRRR